MPLAPKDRAALNTLFLRDAAPADALTPALRAQLATADQGSRADTAFSWGDPTGRFATAAQGINADVAYSWGNHAGVYVLQRTGTPAATFVVSAARGTHGGAGIAAPTWNVRVFNAQVGDGTAGGITVAAGTLTVPNGVYLIMGWAQASGVGSHQTRLRLISAGARTLATGSSEVATGGLSSRSTVETVATLSSASGFSDLQLQHRIQTPASTQDMGRAADLDDAGEVFAGLTFWRLL